ncbi:hypothetical protein [Hufsiella ginkgonis]|nr:hypothetical protein [Hufsiella ginkgonis]
MKKLALSLLVVVIASAAPRKNKKVSFRVLHIKTLVESRTIGTWD